jgi:predicted  nucleic acid-binding Zn-ribbon protein
VGAKREHLERLSRLQVLDDQVRRLEAELAEKPRLVAHERKAVEDARARLAGAEKAARDAHVAADRLELDVRTKEEAIKKLEGQLNTATSNKVYSELLLNIRSARADIEKIEEQILARMDDTEALEGEVEKARVVVRNAEDEFRESEKAMQAQAKEVGERLGQRKGMRDLLAKEIDPEVLAIYERVRSSRKGIGIAMLTVDGEGSHFCAACQMDVPIQEVSLAIAGDKVVQCRSCNRILCVETLPVSETGEARDSAKQ